MFGSIVSSFPFHPLADDPVGISGPDERPRVGIGLGNEALDGALNLNEGAKHAPAQPALRELGKEALHRVESGGSGRCEVIRSPAD